MAVGLYAGGYAPANHSGGNAGANSIFLSPITALQNATVNAILIDGGTVTTTGIQLKALIYDGSHSALLATGSIVTSFGPGYNRLPLTSPLNITAGTTYYVGYVCNTNCTVGIQSSAGPGAWFVSGGQSVTTPANPLVGGSANANTLMFALELDSTGALGSGWATYIPSGVILSGTNNPVATFSAATNLGVESSFGQVPAGRYYAEIGVSGTVDANTGIGLASINWSLTQGAVPVSGGPGFLGLLYTNASVSGGGVISAMTFASGDTIGVAYDSVNGLMWWNKNNGIWWGINAASGSPSAETNGHPFNAQGWPVVVAASTNTAAAAVFTLRDTAGTLLYTPPGGYAAWSTSPVVTYGDVTQVGVEEWVTGNPLGQVTQVGVEEWVAGNPLGQVTQIGIEEWVTATSDAQVTQVGVEEWARVVVPLFPGQIRRGGFRFVEEEPTDVAVWYPSSYRRIVPRPPVGLKVRPYFAISST